LYGVPGVREARGSLLWGDPQDPGSQSAFVIEDQLSGSVAGADSELAERRREMALDVPFSHEQLLPDLGVGEAEYHNRENLPLAWR